jgi:replicative DNA helicase
MKRSLLYRNEAEKCVIASMLMDPSTAGEVLAALRPDDYWNTAYKLAHAAIEKIVERGHDIDLFLVYDEALALGATADDTMLIQAVADEIPNPQLIGEYIEQVRDASIRRRANERLVKAHATLITERGSASDLLYSIASDIVKPVGESAVNTLVPIADVAVRELDRVHANRPSSSVPYPWDSANVVTGGMSEEQLIVVGARPGVGKTAVGLQMALHCAMNGGRVLYVSAEMSARQLWQRMVHQLLGISPVRFARGILDEDQKKSLAQLSAEFVDRPVHLNVMDSGLLSPETVSARARLMQASGGLDLIVVDYLQLLDAKSAESRAQEVSYLTAKIKGMARSLMIPVVLLSQLNRKSAAEDRAPDLHDLRESGSIEQDADLVFLLHRKISGTTSDITRTLFTLAKHRMGPTAVFKCEYSLDRGVLERMICHE